MNKSLLLFLPLLLLSDVNKSKLIDCYVIFEERKSELDYQLSQIIEQRQALQALTDASKIILEKKEANVTQTLSDINASLEEIKNEKQAIESLVAENKRVLEEIQQAKEDKLVQTYSKMRAGNAADILSAMNEETSLPILVKLPAKVISKIFAKMDAARAAELSQKLHTYIPPKKEE